jgi:protein TonB
MGMPAKIQRVLLAAALWGASLGVLAASEAAVVSKVDPEFPREAVVAGADKGKVRARMTLDGTGEVTHVEILEATPRRIFDRAVVKTLSQWKFNSGSDGRMVEIDLDFHR